MAAGLVEPRVDDFGITEEDLERAPCVFLAGHRPAVIAAVYLASALGLFALLLRAGGSASAASFFTLIALAAGSILLLPILMLVVCASERMEERWLCSRFPKLSACLAYREAVANHERRRRAAVSLDLASRTWWSNASVHSFVEASRSELESVSKGVIASVDRDTSGIDFEIGSDSGPVLVRCEPGARPISAAVGRELVAALADRGAVKALIVTAADVTPALEVYIERRPIFVVPPWELQAQVADVFTE